MPNCRDLTTQSVGWISCGIHPLYPYCTIRCPNQFPESPRQFIGLRVLEHPLSNGIRVVLLSLNSTTLEFSISFRNSAITDTTASVFNNLNLAVPLYRILSLVRHSTQQLGIPQMNHLGPKTHLCI